MTGAGISAESGIPTFRGKDGLYKNWNASRLASREGFEEDPELVWGWYLMRRAKVLEASPNNGHVALARWANAHEVPIITQNVDGLHQKAGTSSVFEMHGNLHENRCEACGYSGLDGKIIGKLVYCQHCDRLMRPNVVWFGESLDHLLLSQIYRRISQAELFLVIGTSGQVYPAAALAIEFRKKGLPVIEINIEQPKVTYLNDILLLGKAGDILPALLE
jgi:NAD-dependent deacetylase